MLKGKKIEMSFNELVEKANSNSKKFSCGRGSTCPFVNTGQFARYMDKFLAGQTEQGKDVRQFREKINLSAEGISTELKKVVEGGGGLNVAAYLSGRRDCFQRRVRKERKEVKIYLSFSFPYWVTKTQIENRLAAAVAMVRELRLKGVNVTLHLHSVTEIYKKIWDISVNITDMNAHDLKAITTEKFTRGVLWAAKEKIAEFSMKNQTPCVADSLIENPRDGVLLNMTTENYRTQYKTLENAVKSITAAYNKQVD